MARTLIEIAEHISNAGFSCKCEKSSDDALRSLRLLQSNFRRIKPNCLYFGRVSDLPPWTPEHETTNLILIEDIAVPQEYYSDNNIRLILTDSSAEFVELFNCLQDVFEESRLSHFRSWSLLLNSISNEKGIDTLVQSARQYLGNPIMLCDQLMGVVASSSESPPPEDSSWVFGIMNRNLPDGYIEEMWEVICTKQRVKHDLDIWIWDRDPGESRIILARVTLWGEHIGLFKVLEENRSFTQNDIDYITLLCKVMAVAIHVEMMGTYIPKTSDDSLVHLLISQSSIITDTFLQADMKQCNWHVQETLYVLRIEPLISTKETESMLSYVREQLQKILVNGRSAISQQGIVFILDAKRFSAPIDSEVQSQLIEYLTKKRMCAALSGCYYKLTDTPKYYKQVKKLLRMERGSGNMTLIRYDKYALKYMMHVYAQSENLTEFCHPLAIWIKEYDEVNSTDYARTLYVFMQHSQNVNKASQELFIHYNTMKYRLQKLQDQFGIDFTDGELMLHLWMSFFIIAL